LNLDDLTISPLWVIIFAVEIFKPIKLHCGVGETLATINVKGGQLVDNAKGYVESACVECVHWTDEKVRQVDTEVEHEWGPEHVHQGRVNKLEQHLVDQSRFRREVEKKIVVAMCTPLGAR